MFKGIVIGDTAVAANTNVPFTVVRNTNRNTAYDIQDNAVNINAPGYYDISATIVATSTAAATVTAQLFANGVPIPGATSTFTIAAAGTGTFTLIDNEKVDLTNIQSLANISIQFDAAVTVNDAVLLIETRR
jgi:hypothetical protein